MDGNIQQPAVITGDPNVMAANPYGQQSVLVQPEPVKSEGMSGWGWVIGIIVVIIIIIVIVCIVAACWNNNKDDDDCKTKKACPRKKHCQKSVPDLDGNISDPVAANQPVALLELTGDGWVELDRSIANILEVYNAERPIGSRVLIRDTQSSIERTKTLWQEAVNAGHRKFIGGSRSDVLAALEPLIVSRPDTAFVSLGSTAPSLAKRNNIYRLSMNDTSLIPAVPQYLKNRYDYIHILEQEDSIWARELTALLVESLRAEGVRVGVTKVGGPIAVPLPANPVNTPSSYDSCSTRASARESTNAPSDGVVRTTDQLNAELSCSVPDGSNMAFIDIVESNLVQQLFTLIDDAPWAQTKHYGLAPMIYFPFEGKAKSAAEKTELEVLAYNPIGTLESEAVLQRTGRDLVNPLAISGYDAAVAFERAAVQELENYFRLNRGITGLLSVNASGDRESGGHLLWAYNRGDWKPERWFSRLIPHGDFLGFFDNPEATTSDPSRESTRDDYYDQDCNDSGRNNYRDDYRDDYYDSPRGDYHASPRGDYHASPRGEYYNDQYREYGSASPY
jgi:hypothetical protein